MTNDTKKWPTISELGAVYRASALVFVDLNTNEHKYKYYHFRTQARADAFAAQFDEPVRGRDAIYASEGPINKTVAPYLFDYNDYDDLEVPPDDHTVRFADDWPNFSFWTKPKS